VEEFGHVIRRRLSMFPTAARASMTQLDTDVTANLDDNTRILRTFASYKHIHPLRKCSTPPDPSSLSLSEPSPTLPYLYSNAPSHDVPVIDTALSDPPFPYQLEVIKNCSSGTDTDRGMR
jgi:hypothetical protein